MVGSSGSSWRLLASFVLMLACVAGLAAAEAQTGEVGSGAAGCTLQKKEYVCDWSAFRSRLDAAHTIAVDARPMERNTAKQLRKMVQKLGKSVVGKGEAADLRVVLTPVSPTGIHIGPRGEPVATLRFYAPESGIAAAGTKDSNGTLVWAEVWTGNSDRPWPSIVYSLIQQFEARFKSR